MRALVVYCHPQTDSFNAAVKDLVVKKLRAAGAEVRLSDLYGKGFQPVLTSARMGRVSDLPAEPRCRRR